MVPEAPVPWVMVRLPLPPLVMLPPEIFRTPMPPSRPTASQLDRTNAAVPLMLLVPIEPPALLSPWPIQYSELLLMGPPLGLKVPTLRLPTRVPTPQFPPPVLLMVPPVILNVPLPPLRPVLTQSLLLTVPPMRLKTAAPPFPTHNSPLRLIEPFT